MFPKAVICMIVSLPSSLLLSSFPLVVSPSFSLWIPILSFSVCNFISSQATSEWCKMHVHFSSDSFQLALFRHLSFPFLCLVRADILHPIIPWCSPSSTFMRGRTAALTVCPMLGAGVRRLHALRMLFSCLDRQLILLFIHGLTP